MGGLGNYIDIRANLAASASGSERARAIFYDWIPRRKINKARRIFVAERTILIDDTLATCEIDSPRNPFPPIGVTKIFPRFGSSPKTTLSEYYRSIGYFPYCFGSRSTSFEYYPESADAAHYQGPKASWSHALTIAPLRSLPSSSASFVASVAFPDSTEISFPHLPRRFVGATPRANERRFGSRSRFALAWNPRAKHHW